jgi:hypothetical protein
MTDTAIFEHLITTGNETLTRTIFPLRWMSYPYREALFQDAVDLPRFIKTKTGMQLAK